MKTKELIRRLQEADPSGETECCVGNEDIYHIEDLPAYYDGPLEVLIHDPELRDKSYSVVGAKVVRSGRKIKINPLSIEDAIFDEKYSGKDLPVEVIMDSTDGYYAKKVEDWRASAAKILLDIKGGKI